jgi:hypothetical protein
MARSGSARERPTPPPRKPLLAGPARVVGKRLPVLRAGKGYRPAALDIVERNARDGFEVFCREAAAVEALRTYGARSEHAVERTVLLETWPTAPQEVAPLLRRTLDLAAREFRWADPEDEAGYERSTRSAIARFLAWMEARESPPSAR